MSPRERFLEVMNFNTRVPTLKWEFGYWGENAEQLVCTGVAAQVSANAGGGHHAHLDAVYGRMELPAHRRASQRLPGDGWRALLAHARLRAR